ncbi:hypothetical protein C8J57DRAFT_1599173 [Mycena rebaudengoi]|nr:hypothetical protein C8J57DRAFT_1599173 [Mycena rebaudengoi]
MSLEAPLFPLELERHIFELAAFSHRGIIPTLLRVARVLVWIEPLLYRVVHVKASPVGTTRHAGATYATRQAFQSKPLSFFQNLPFDMSFSMQSQTGHHRKWSSVFRAAQELLALQHSYPPRIHGFFRPWGKFKRADYISFWRTYLDLTHPMFASVTHFDVFDNVSTRRWERFLSAGGRLHGEEIKRRD